jgi:hypothetical protein
MIETQTWTMFAAGMFLIASAWVASFYQRRIAIKKTAGPLEILPLTPSETQRFSEAWASLQNRFVDNPKWTITEADQLSRELMQKRGYPMDDFERRAADISIDRPDMVANYRAAQAIVARDQRGTADIGHLRQAVMHYRALFDELLEVRNPKEAARENGRPAEEHAY